MPRLPVLLCVLLPVVVALPGCAPGPDTTETAAAGPTLTERMGGAPDPGFERAFEPREFRFPGDHGPHPGFATEWWYFTGNLETAGQRRFGYQLTLFRVGLKPGKPEHDSAWRSREIYMGHLAVSDIERQRHIGRERFSRAAAGLAGAESAPLRVWLGSWSIEGTNPALFPLRLRADDADIAIDLELQAGDRDLVLQGERGLSQKSAEPGNASYYYSYTRLPTVGQITVNGEAFRVEGNSWFDREWSSSALGPDQAGWDWFALQLDDGRDLMFYRLRQRDGGAGPFSRGILVKRDGSTVPLPNDAVELQPLRHWQAADGTAYPVEWRLQVPSEGIALRVSAAFDTQEMTTTVRYWEGAVDVSGSHTGRGYLELSGYAD